MIPSRAIFAFAAAFAVFCCLGTAPSVLADSAKLDKVLAGDHRSDANKARDKYRHPRETLEFFGVKPDATVIEVWPGGGWYTEVLAPYLRDGGRYIALFPATATRGLKNFEDKLASRPGLYDKVKIAKIAPATGIDMPPAGGADVVLTFRNVHNWIDADIVDVYMKAFFDALKPGGVLGVVDHRAKPGAGVKAMIESGYLTEDFVVKRALAAGFRLDARSEINANPKDSKDYKKGVWTLPPTLTEGETDKAKYLEIGESDRMTLRFVKPGK